MWQGTCDAGQLTPGGLRDAARYGKSPNDSKFFAGEMKDDSKMKSRFNNLTS